MFFKRNFSKTIEELNKIPAQVTHLKTAKKRLRSVPVLQLQALSAASSDESPQQSSKKNCERRTVLWSKVAKPFEHKELT